ncbi:MAG: kynureninase [Geodermatophilaceae bacterium]|nr:kynureninase [Geodermatophilaceae bacterium]
MTHRRPKLRTTPRTVRPLVADGARPYSPRACDLADARRRDDEDPLGEFRERFLIGPAPVAYLDGNSLGRPPKATIARLNELLTQEWAGRLILSWEERWVDLPAQVGDQLGETVLGAAPGQTLIADSTTVNLFKVLHAACGLRPDRAEIVVDDANFPTDRFIVEAIAADRGLTVRWVSPDPESGVRLDELAGVLGPQTAVVSLSHVDYRSGYIADLAGITAAVHDAGALAVWDLCHSAGVVPIALDAAEVDFAVGCTYKYLNAGPGAPAFLFVADRHLPLVEQPISGWFGAADTFAMAARYEPAPDVRRMLSGTPSVLGIVAVQEGVKLIAEAGLDRIRTKGVDLTEYAIALADRRLAPFGATVASPRAARERGGHVTIRCARAEDVTRRLIAAAVVPDFRNPDLIRLGMSPLTTSYEEVWLAIDIFAGILVGN